MTMLSSSMTKRDGARIRLALNCVEVEEGVMSSWSSREQLSPR